jgi:hypothetical protein
MSTVQGGQGNIVTNGLVLNLDAANPRSYPQPYDGTTWQNIAPVSSSISGSLINGVAYTGSNNGALVFDGTDDYAVINQSTSNTNFTFEIFLNCTNVSKDQIYVGTSIPATYVRILNSQPYLSIRTSVSAQKTFSPSITLLNNQIYHIVSLYDGIQMKIYVNGIVYNDNPINESMFSWSLNRIGIWRDADPRNFPGNIYSFRLYNRALNPSEVLQNFNATRARFGI